MYPDDFVAIDPEVTQQLASPWSGLRLPGFVCRFRDFGRYSVGVAWLSVAFET